MTIPAQTIYNSYTANGVTTVFPYGFKILDEADLKVSVDDVEVTTGFTVSGVGSPTGGNVTFTVAPLTTLKVLLELDPVLARTTDYQQFGDWQASVANNDFDALWLAIQKISHDGVRSLKLPVDTTTSQALTGDATARAGKGIKFDVSGNMILTDADPDANAASAAAVLGDIAPAIHIATNKATPVGADELGIWDSVSGLLNRVSFTNLVTYLRGLCSAGWNAATATSATNATTSTTQSKGNSSTAIATTAFVRNEGLCGSSFASYSATGSLTTDDLGRPFFWNSASSGTLTLPASAGVGTGQIIACYVNSSAAGILTIARNGTDVIFSEYGGSVTSIDLIGGDFLTLICGGGGGWVVLAKANGGIGRNQTWQSVIGSRAINTNYTNTTGRPIQVNVSGTFAYGATVKINVDSISSHYTENNQSGLTLWWALSVIVPPNSVFNVVTTGTAPTVSTWAELR